TWPAPNCTPFTIDITGCAAQCSRNPNLADNCAAPTMVSLGLNDTVCGFSDYQYTPDVTTDLDNDFCGSIENNGWFAFVADSAQMTLQFDVGNCITGFGVQGGIFETTDCINYNMVSTCWNPQIEANGVMQATGLTVGNTYYLMIDGYAGDDCEFNIYRIGQLLPVEWGPFTADVDENDVVLNWSTYAEVNNKGFHVLRGRKDKSAVKADNMTWESVTFIKGRGDDPDGHSYSYTDNVPYDGEAYFYRIQQLDLNGNSDFSDVVEVRLEGPQESDLMQVYPNPASDFVNLNYYVNEAGSGSLAIVDISGRIVKRERLDLQNGVYEHSIPIHDLGVGSYFYILDLPDQNFRGRFEVIR
ncbi:MAG: T9SS type A sorting domain-containing protein, partial [Bacteroidota bacterium]